MTYFERLAAGLGLLLLAGTAGAEALQLQDALRLAVTQHPTVAMRASQRDAAAEALDAAGRGRYPAFSGQTGKDAAGKNVFTLRIEQAVWTGGRITGEIAGADAALRGAAATVTESQQDILLRTVSAYAELGRYDASASAARANVAEHERLYRLIGHRIDNQITSSSDGLLAEARLSQARAEFSQFNALRIRARARLGELVGTAVDAIAPEPLRQGRPASLEAALEAATAFSPVLKRLAAQEDGADADIQVRRGQALPQVKLRHDRTQGGDQPGSQTFLMLEYQSGAGLASLAAVRASEARRQAARAERQAALRDVVDAVGSDWADLASFEAQAHELHAQVAATTRVFESFVRQYAVGRKSWIEVLNAQRETSQARYAHADAAWSGWRAALRLQIATGQLTAATLSDVSRTYPQ